MMLTGPFSEVARVALPVLLNSLWQGAVIALVAWGVLRVFSRANAATRYAIWACALIAMVAIPVVTSIPRVSLEAAPAVATKILAQTNATSRAPETPQAAQPAVSPARMLPQFSIPQLRFSNALALAIFGLWSLAALFVLVRLVVAILTLERLKRDSLPLDVAYRDQMPQWNAALKEFRDVRLCVSDAIDVPVAIGLFDAMILLPSHLIASLDPKEIDQIALHELGHLRRNDDWTNAVQRVACALLFFNPAAWFVSRQLDLEREVACDDYVLEATGAARSYAFCLTRIAEVTAWPRSGVAAAPGVFLTRRNISVRIERVLRTGRSIGSAIAPEIAATVVVALAFVLMLARTMTPSVAYSLPNANRIAPAAAPAVAQKHVQHVVLVQPHAATIAKHVAKAKPSTVPLLGSVVGSAVTPILGPQVASAVEEGINKGLSDAKVADAGDPCAGCDYSHGDYRGHDFSKQNLTGADFDHANLQGARFDGARLSGANFDHANLRNASFLGADLIGCNLDHARLEGARFDGARLMGCNFNAQSLSPQQARIFLAQCAGCNFEGADLHGLDLRNIKVRGANLEGANLSGADLSGASFIGVNLSDANVAGANLRDARFTGCNLDGVDLDAADTTGATFQGSNYHRGSRDQ